MAVLTLNGWTVPVRDGSALHSTEEQGETVRTVSGRLSRTRSALNDVYEGALPVTDPETSLALRGLLQGRGHRWAFEGSIGTYNDGAGTGIYSPLWSSKGLLFGGTARVRLAEVVTEYDGTNAATATHPKFGSVCLAPETATTNLWPQNVRTGTDSGGVTTGFSASVAGAAAAGATLTSSTTVAWQQTKALKCVTGAVGAQGWRTDPVAVASTKVAGSVYLRSVAGATVDVYLRNTTAGTNGASKTMTLADSWQRVELASTGTSGDSWSLVVENHTAAAQTFYADGLQLEAGAAFCATWIDAAAGATATIAASAHSAVVREAKARDDWTIQAWARQPVGARTGNKYLFHLGNTVEGIRAYASAPGSAGATFSVDVLSAGILLSNTSGPANSFAAGAWHHVAVVVRRNPLSTSHKLELYYDAVLVGYSDAALPALGDAPTLWLGCSSDSLLQWDGLIDELVVLPFGATAEQITAWYASAFSDLPQLLAGGDHLGGGSTDTVAVLGEVTSESFQQVSLTSGWSNRAEAVGFKLREVG